MEILSTTKESCTNKWIKHEFAHLDSLSQTHIYFMGLTWHFEHVRGPEHRDNKDYIQQRMNTFAPLKCNRIMLNRLNRVQRQNIKRQNIRRLWYSRRIETPNARFPVKQFSTSTIPLAKHLTLYSKCWGKKNKTLTTVSGVISNAQHTHIKAFDYFIQ